jgi:hypothetical protein
MAAEQKFTTLQELLKHKELITAEAASKHHDGFVPTVPRAPVEEEVSAPVRKNGTAPPKEEVGRGRILLFLPTNEKITILKERVGQSYGGDWLHEVTTRDGHKFLAMQKQLK